MLIIIYKSAMQANVLFIVLQIQNEDQPKGKTSAIIRVWKERVSQGFPREMSINALSKATKVEAPELNRLIG